MKKEKFSMAYKWIVVMVVATGTIMTTMDVGIIRIALPHLSDVFQVDPNTILWLTLVYLLIGTGLMLSFGQIGDTFGRKKLYTAGLIIFSVGLGLSALAQNFTQLMIFRVFQSVGAAMILANGNAIITASFPAEERGKALGVIGAVVGTGLLAGPALGGILIDIFDWRAIFYLRLPIGIIGAIMAWILIKETPVPKNSIKFDFIGAVTIFITMACLLLFVNQGQSLGWTSPFVIILGLVCVISFIIFIFVEKRVSRPVVDLTLFRIRLLRVASASHIINFIGSASSNFLLPFFLIQGLNLSSSKSGLILVTIPAVFIIIAPLAGRLSDKIGTRFLCTFGLTLTSFGVFLLMGMGDDVSTINIIWRLFILGIGMALFDSPNSSAIMGSVPLERLGTASAMVATLRQVGMSVGTAVAGTIFTASSLSYADQLNSQGLAGEVVKMLSTVHGFHSAVIATLIFPIMAAVISIFRDSKTKQGVLD
ncbi:MAG: MFS transporter [Dehalococcoidales bacterium]|nr:MFS transporter [Dehalococcoidales bacterium]